MTLLDSIMTTRWRLSRPMRKRRAALVAACAVTATGLAGVVSVGSGLPVAAVAAVAQKYAHLPGGCG